MKNSFFLLLLLGLACLVACKQDANTEEVSEEEEIERPYKLICLGSDFSIGAGLDPLQAYPALLQQRFDSLGISTKVVNASIKGETLQGANERIYWLLQQRFDGMLLELGQNEAKEDSSAVAGLEALVQLSNTIKENKPEADLFFLDIGSPTPLSEEWTSRFESLLKAQGITRFSTQSLDLSTLDIEAQHEQMANWLADQLQEKF